MQFHYNITCLTLLWILFFLFPTISGAGCEEKHTTIRVLLDEASTRKTWHLQAKDGFLIYDVNKKHKKVLPTSTVKIDYHGGSLYVQGQPISDRVLHLIAVNGNITFENNLYHGLITIMLHDKGVYCINHVELEDYVCCVLRTESWPGWPLEVNKVFAIASRSYAIAMMQKARKQKKPFDLRNTNAHQTYAGIHQVATIKRAVEETKGTILIYDGKPIIAMFDACCGGITPSDIAYYNFTKAPYLARNYPCKYCKKCKVFSWKAEFDQKQLKDRLGSVFIANRLQDVAITKKDKAGLIEEVHLKGPGEHVKIPGRKFYSLLKEIKSFCYKVRKQGSKFYIQGWGYGHHIGLCQWGARQMVKEGWPYSRILSFYYPKTELRKLA